MCKLFLVLCLALSVSACDKPATNYSCGNHKGNNGKLNPCNQTYIDDNNGNLKYPRSDDPSKYVECFKPNGKKLDYKCRVQSCGQKQFDNELQACDINECAVNNGGCEHRCENYEGGYACICDVGFELQDDGHSCAGHYEYAATCLPTHYFGVPGFSGCTMYVHCGPKPANINIITIHGTQSLSLQSGEVQKITFNQNMFPVDEIESKAIRVKADENVQVLIYKNDFQQSGERFDGVYEVSRLSPYGTNFVTSGYNEISCGNSNYGSQIYVISSFYDNTNVQIIPQGGTPFQVVLTSFGSYVHVAPYGTIASGTQITSEKAINVISGNICEHNELYRGTYRGGTYISNIPSTTNLAHHYLIPHLIAQSRESAGYSLHVVASEDNTVVQLDDDPEVELLSVGSDTTFELPDRREWMSLSCSKPCLAVQYSKSVSNYIGLFMFSMIAPQDFYSSAFFTTLDIHPVSYLSLVVEGEDPCTDILLNGVSLNYLDWGALDGYATAEMAINQGSYTLESVTGRLFAAYVYTHTEDYTGGAGYALLPTYYSSPPPTSMPLVE